MNTPYSVRFHLAEGEHYMNWQIRSKDYPAELRANAATYVKPKEKTLVLLNCTLKNQRKLAEQIHQGRKKTVCAWVQCSDVYILSGQRPVFSGKRIAYNPKVLPHWTNSKREDIDNLEAKCIVSQGHNLVLCDYAEIVSNDWIILPEQAAMF